MDASGRLVFRGHFKADVRVGLAEVLDDYGGRVIGLVDEQGEHTGEHLTCAIRLNGDRAWHRRAWR